ncbi:putative mucin TcMUCII [Trypanosoma cruzi]|uniref:Mucin TcMUCII, putative n=2 Tax=Trypanosoma cruzi TaxID=5693 RepID=Q4DDS0_TRYCC|nr:mucin TcMUCII, putative [Trypanosoma cruzi]EAN90667.1 mucin TcMUCII, putative [Trypanosoma cruzi]PWV14698.1 putative mucin TcMUCII [Trypanosoma cruzi]|eukprot:XP_812518.1 mucin TcMUCII [Trypanosoma cruzi strain CL Brener]
MTTCRLLCALLVLALCCCPSVCVTEGSGEQDAGSGSTTAQSQGSGGAGLTNTSTEPNSTGPTDASPSKIPGSVTVEITGNDAKQPHGTPSSQGTGDAVVRNGPTSITAASAPDSAGPAKTLQEPATISEAGGKGPLSQSSNGQTQSGNPTSQGSSAGTGVPETPGTEGPEPITKEVPSGSDGSGSSGGSANPNTSSSSVTAPVSAQIQKENAPTTTTTTTTKAPTTTTTTTTEAPTTTTTTRAPSLLRESDGSLSSSAWVCAPLLLAVSALAYTALG